MNDGQAGQRWFGPDSRAGQPYCPIRDYALIGDCHGAALVAIDGSIDWCTFGRFDADPVLWRLLDSAQGSFFQIAPTEKAQVDRKYLPGTNVLHTVYRTPEGRVSVTDCMPVGRAADGGAADYVTLTAPGCIMREVEGLEGISRVRIQYQPPRCRFATLRSSQTPVDAAGETGGPSAGVAVRIFSASDGGGTSSYDETVEIPAGETRIFVLAPENHADAALVAQAPAMLRVTIAFWREWLGQCCYEGPYTGAVYRSALILKLLTFAPSGAIVAAPTTSLPEEPGGIRNWDYRYSWLRDSAFVLHALAALGYSAEARAFCDFQRLCCVGTLPLLQIMYGIGGETELQEHTLDHLDGYLQSRPVRIGNAAYQQHQMDVYGETLDWAMVYWALGGSTDETQKALIHGVADYIAAHWQEPDQGLWEMRGEPRHHVHSKMMAWVALDRAIQMLGETPAWVEARTAILQAILAHGVDPGGRHLVQAFDHPGTDAALPGLGIPLDHDLLARTVEAVERELREGDYVRRYRTSDGLPGSEGAFLICSFWLVDALLLLGRADEARALFERLIAKGTVEGLYAEEVVPSTEAFLGNFPQAFTHLALVNSAIHLQLHEQGGKAAVSGSQADRAQRSAVTSPVGSHSATESLARNRAPSQESVFPKIL